MKKSILLLLSVLLILLIIPISAGTLSSDTRKAKITADDSIYKTTKNNLSDNKDELNDDEIDYILTKALEYADENTDREAVKAIITLCRNNFLFHKNTNTSQDEVNIDSYSDEFLEELRNLYKEIEITLLYNTEIVYIPITKTSPGYIVTDGNYPYIVPVACPWDKLSEDYSSDVEYTCGISVNSIKYLCENNSDYIDAISWHLPNLTLINKKIN